MNLMKLAMAVGLIVFSGTASAVDIDVGKIFVESLVEGAMEDGCGDKGNVHRMMGSSNDTVRKQGYACFGAKQAEKINKRMKGIPIKPENACWRDKKRVMCNVWFPETVINGETIPAGYRKVEMGK